MLLELLSRRSYSIPKKGGINTGGTFTSGINTDEIFTTGIFTTGINTTGFFTTGINTSGIFAGEFPPPIYA